MEREDSKMGLQQLECMYILRGKQRVKAWQEDVAGMRMAIKKRGEKKKQWDSCGEQSN